MTTDYEIRLCDQYGTALAVIVNFIRLDFARAANDAGWFTLQLADGAIDDYLVEPDRLLYIHRKPEGGRRSLEMVGFLTKPKWKDDSEGLTTLLLNGPDQNGLLKRRTVQYRAGQSETEKANMEADDLMKEIVTENVGPPPITDGYYSEERGLAQFTCADDLTLGPQTSISCAWRNVLTVLQEVAITAAELGTAVYFDVVPTKPGWFEFRTYIGQMGIDRTYPDGEKPVIFGVDRGNLHSPSLEYDYERELNHVIGLGWGNAQDREIDPERWKPGLYRSIWNRRESTQDARGQSTREGIAAMAQMKLRENRPLRRFRGELVDTPLTRYGVDYGFGDMVSSVYRGQFFVGMVSAVRVRVDEDGSEQVIALMESTVVA